MFRPDREGQQIPGVTEFNCGGGEEIVHGPGIKFYRHGPFGRWWSPHASQLDMRNHIVDPKTSWYRNCDTLEFNLQSGMPPVTIFVEPGVTISGRVTDPQGAPVENATITPVLTGSGNALTSDTRYSVRSAKDGAYQLVIPASHKATYNLFVHDGDHQEWRHWASGVSEPLQTTPGQKIDGLNLQLSEPATIRGRVTKDGRPVAQIEVKSHDFDRRGFHHSDPVTKTKDDGTFELKFVRSGKQYLQVAPVYTAEDAAEYAPHTLKIVEVKAGETLEGVELDAAPRK